MFCLNSLFQWIVISCDPILQHPVNFDRCKNLIRDPANWEIINVVLSATQGCVYQRHMKRCKLTPTLFPICVYCCDQSIFSVNIFAYLQFTYWTLMWQTSALTLLALHAHWNDAPWLPIDLRVTKKITKMSQPSKLSLDRNACLFIDSFLLAQLSAK